MIWLIKLLRYRLVWTMHNRLPHEPQTADDVRVTRTILAKSDAVIVHSPAAAADIASQLKQTTLILTGAQGPYPTMPAIHTPAEIRHEHAIPSDAVLFLFCGWIREYKGIPELLAAFRELDEHPPVHLIVAGECDNPTLQAAILQEAESAQRLTYLPGYLPDPELASYLLAADYVCLPFRRLTTSSSAMLALSYLRPVIAPMLGDLVDLPPACGYFYDPEASAGLFEALVAAANAGPPQDCRTGAIASFIRGSSWAQLAEVTLTAYRQRGHLSSDTNNRSTDRPVCEP
jgi:glycosyltransferase involved in cell wall biosynthesis